MRQIFGRWLFEWASSRLGSGQKSNSYKVPTNFLQRIFENFSIFSEILTQKRSVCDLLWHPTEADCLILCDVKGYVGIVKGIFSEPTTIVDEKISSVVDQYESFDIDDEATRGKRLRH